MLRHIITDNIGEYMEVKFDEERFAFIQRIYDNAPDKIILLNPREALELATFVLKIYPKIE